MLTPTVTLISILIFSIIGLVVGLKLGHARVH
jgi:hypothetical protein